MPIRVRRYRLCERCGLKTPRGFEQCRHCADLPDEALPRLHERHAAQLRAARGLGPWLAGAALLLALSLFMLS